MVKIECGTIRCKDKVKFYNTSEECYYCKDCALTLFNENEYIKIGSLNDIQRLLEVCKNLWDEVQVYVSKEQLAQKWRLELDAHKVFQIEINCITNELNDILMNGKLINLSDIYKRTSNLKYQITDSQIFIKYLKHKQLSKHIDKEWKFDKKKLVTQTVCDLAELRAEESRLMLRDRFQMWADILGPRSSDTLYLEEFRKTHEAEMNEIKNKGEKDIEALQNENAKLHAKIVEDREELNECKRKYNDYINTSLEISYDVFGAFYKQFIGHEIKISEQTDMIFNLNEGKWLSFARTLSKHSLPKIRRISLDYIPSDSNDVGDFMINSINSENFEFNKNKQIQIDGSKYLSSLMKVAEKTSNYFNVYNTKLSAHEFCGIIESAKSVKELGFIYSLVSLDSEIDFGDNMKDCKIECINLSYSGGSVYSNWSAYPERFENMISSISKCAPLVKSLKSLIIQYCDLTREKSQAILNKYKMNKVKLHLEYHIKILPYTKTIIPAYQHLLT